MSKIAKLTITTDRIDHDFETVDRKYFYDIDQAKEWCSDSIGCEIEWKEESEYFTYSPEIYVKGDIVTFVIETITMTILDEDDGE